MKTYFLIFILAFGLSTTAQNNRKQQIAAMRVAFLTKNLELTPTEAQQFWPIYDAYSDAVSKLQKEERTTLRELRQGGFDKLSEKDAKNMLDRHIAIQSTKINARKKLIDDLESVLPPKKILILLKSEEDFKRSIFERLKERRKNFRRQ